MIEWLMRLLFPSKRLHPLTPDDERSKQEERLREVERLAYLASIRDVYWQRRQRGS